MKITTKKVTLLALCIAMNMVGSWIGVMIKLPVYLDSIGTVMAGFAFGPVFGILAGVITALVNTISDPIALYFMPTQIIVGFTAGYF